MNQQVGKGQRVSIFDSWFLMSCIHKLVFIIQQPKIQWFKVFSHSLYTPVPIFSRSSLFTNFFFFVSRRVGAGMIEELEAANCSFMKSLAFFARKN